MLLEERKHFVVKCLYRGHRKLRRVESAPGVPAVAIDHALKIDAANALQSTDHERIHCDQFSGAVGLDVPLSKLWTEPLEKPDLLVTELDLAFSRVFLEPQEPLVSKLQVGGKSRYQKTNTMGGSVYWEEVISAPYPETGPTKSVDSQLHGSLKSQIVKIEDQRLPRTDHKYIDHLN